MKVDLNYSELIMIRKLLKEYIDKLEDDKEFLIRCYNIPMNLKIETEDEYIQTRQDFKEDILSTEMQLMEMKKILKKLDFKKK